MCTEKYTAARFISESSDIPEKMISIWKMHQEEIESEQSRAIDKKKNRGTNR